MVAFLAACVAVLGPAEPLDSTAASAALIGVGAFVTVWAAASASWWALAVAAGVAAATAFDPVLAALAALAFVAALVIGLRQRHQSLERSLVAAVVVNVLARSELENFQGLSAIVAVAVCIFSSSPGSRAAPTASDARRRSQPSRSAS